MGKYDFMEQYEEKLQRNVEKAERDAQEAIAKALAEERNRIAKDLFNIYSNSEGEPTGELREAMKGGGFRSGD